jgi:hypothetical protein
LNSKGERENAKIWSDLMKNDNKWIHIKG